MNAATALSTIPTSPDAAFDADVPEAIRDDVFQEMSDAVSSGEAQGRVSIVDHERVDAFNNRASGVVTIDGREFSFEMEDGNRAGTVLVSWNEDRAFERTEPVQWMVEPMREKVQDAIANGRAATLLMMWDGFVNFRKDVSEIVRGYSYDSHFAPGVVTERHWRGAAAKLHLAIVTKEEADETRKRLQDAVAAVNGASAKKN